jgi:hypothetical protein
MRGWAPLAVAAAVAVVAAPASACCHRSHLLPAGAQPGQVPLAIGDSVMLGAAAQLAGAGFEVDAKEGRVTHAAVTIVERRLREQTLPDTVVIALGTNIPPLPDELARVIRLTGPGRTLLLVTPYRAWRPFGAQAMWRAQRLHRRTVFVADWAAAAGAHPSWFWPDGTHLRPDGARAYATTIEHAAGRSARSRVG